MTERISEPIKPGESGGKPAGEPIPVVADRHPRDADERVDVLLSRRKNRIKPCGDFRNGPLNPDRIGIAGPPQIALQHLSLRRAQDQFGLGAATVYAHQQRGGFGVQWGRRPCGAGGTGERHVFRMFWVSLRCYFDRMTGFTGFFWMAAAR